MAKISICVPSFNTGTYISDCLDRLTNQTFRDIEIIVVDDCSTDKSVEIIESFRQKDDRIKLIRHDKNQGLGGARNTGIKNASGDFIGFVDSDDFVESAMYEKLYRAAVDNQAEIVIANYDFVEDNKRKAGKPKGKTHWFRPVTGKAEPESIYHNTQPWNKLISRDLIERTGFRFFERNGDAAVAALLVHAANIFTLSEELYHYRVGHSSMSTGFSVDHIMQSYDNNVKLRQEISIYPEFFDMKIIESLVQLLYVSARDGQREAFQFAKKKIGRFRWRSNRYFNSLFKKNYSMPMFYVIKYILPFNYYVSMALIRFLLFVKRL